MSALMQPWRCAWLWAELSQEHASCWREINMRECVSQSWFVGEACWMARQLRKVSRLEFICKKCLQMVWILICQRWCAVKLLLRENLLESEGLWSLLKTAGDCNMGGRSSQTGIRDGSSFLWPWPSRALCWEARYCVSLAEEKCLYGPFGVSQSMAKKARFEAIK